MRDGEPHDEPPMADAGVHKAAKAWLRHVHVQLLPVRRAVAEEHLIACLWVPAARCNQTLSHAS
eukprot:1310470-Lingulodinium_polyedra.AAC.1